MVMVALAGLCQRDVLAGQVRQLLLRGGPARHHRAARPQAAQGVSHKFCSHVPRGWYRPGKVQGLCAGATAVVVGVGVVVTVAVAVVTVGVGAVVVDVAVVISH